MFNISDVFLSQQQQWLNKQTSYRQRKNEREESGIDRENKKYKSVNVLGGNKSLTCNSPTS